jgi:polyisoprenoid-binding protein YceI
MGLTPVAHAQTEYKISNSKSNDMKLSGTSTLHKWDMNAQSFNGQARFVFKPGTTQLDAISSLDFVLAVQNLKSESKMMDNNAYKALKTDQYKNISYKLTSATIVPKGGGVSLIKTKGNLTISGVTKVVTMDVTCTLNADATVTCKGEDKLNMTDYNVTPPTFMAGAMKTGDALTLDFTMVYNK